jgi:hypothetical protein
MNTIFQWIDGISYTPLIFAAILLGLAPFVPMPHLYEKWLMFRNGELHKWIDIFDVFYHLIPFIIIAIKFYRQMSNG